MPINLNYDICKTVESVHVNFINKKDILKKLQNEIKSLKNLSQAFNTSHVNALNEQKQQISIREQIKDTQNIIDKDKKEIEILNTILKGKYNDKTSISNLDKDLYKIGLIINENDYKNMVNSSLINLENKIKNLNKQKEIINIRLNHNKSIVKNLNNILNSFSSPNKETLDFLFYTEIFPNKSERESIPPKKINIDCIKNMINIHQKGWITSLDSKMKIKTYTDFLKK
ncbi:hypothetical protein [Proteus penneri]|uniref:hypothetical protein n=1 Tax=Proteus penneri TaxID=102862 RepID=UPI001C5EF62D|nr:hypothetical protein [Proteus penneri]